MTIYIINYLLCSVWIFAKNHKIPIIVIGMQLFLILAFRSDVLGVDVDEYRMMFDYYVECSFREIMTGFRLFANTDILFGRESGYVLLNWLCGNLGLSFHSFLIIQSAVCVFSLCVFISRYSKIPWLSFALIIALGMYTYMFCILRQSLAVAMLYFSFPFIRNREFLKFALLVCLASLFHVVSIVFFPLYWLANAKISTRNLSFFTVISLLLPLLMRGGIAVFLSSLGKTYEFSSDVSYNNLIMVVVIFSVFILLFYNGLFGENHKNDSMFFWGFLMAFPIQMLSLIMPILGRASVGIFFPLASILIPNLIYENKDPDSQTFFSMFFFVAFFGYFLYIFSADSSHIVPYQSFYF